MRLTFLVLLTPGLVGAMAIGGPPAPAQRCRWAPAGDRPGSVWSIDFDRPGTGLDRAIVVLRRR